MEKNNNYEELNNIDMNELKKNVLNKLETKIAVEEYKEKEEIKVSENNNNTSKVKIMRKKKNFLFRVAAVLIGIIFVGNVYTFAAYKENLFSFIVSRIGLVENIEDSGELVNITDESLGNKLTLSNYVLDKESLIVTFN